MQHIAPTIKEIARQLNVSISTVSRALNNNPRIGLATRERIQALARKLNYEPNKQAIHFKQKKTHIIGVILPSIREEFFSEAISGIETAAISQQYTILFGQSYDQLENEKNLAQAMKEQRVDGLLISLSKETNAYDHFKALEDIGIPIVYFDRVPPFEHVNKVYCNLYKATLDMIGGLFNKGLRRVAFINGPDKMLASEERMHGFIDGITAHNLSVDMELVTSTDFSKEKTVQAMSHLLALKPRPQAIITFNDYVYLDAVQYAQSRGVAVNSEIYFLSYANISLTSYLPYPPVISIEQFPNRQGEIAMEFLLKLIQEKNNVNAETKYYQEELIATLVYH